MTRALPILAAFLISASGAAAQAVGYGAAATGGSGGAACHVRDEAKLRACLTGDNPAKVVIDAPLSVEPGRRPIEVGSNKTLDGAGKLDIVHDWIGLRLQGSRNIIVRGVSFRGSGADIFPEKQSNCAHPSRPADVEGCGVSIAMTGAARDVWIDHNDFVACGNKCIDGWGKVQAAGTVPAPDLITISNNVFRDSYYAILFGVAPQVPDDQMPTQPGRVTLYGNLFDDIMRRSPRAAAGYRLHVFNNVIRHFGGRGSCHSIDFGFGPSTVSGGQILLQNNVIEAWPGGGGCKAADYVEPDVPAEASRGEGLIASMDNLTRNGAAASGRDRVFRPGYNFSPLPASQVESAVNANAGVRPGG
ncbi:MAG: hypothetical protein ABI306_02495 [Caulobacteraceae bacterium]